MLNTSNILFYWLTSWRMLWRDWRSGELSILAAGLIIAVTSITAVGFFTDRIERGMQQQAAELLAADVVVTSSRKTVNEHISSARQRQLQVAMTQEFRSVLLSNEQTQLVEVKAVSDDYPLRGELRVSDSQFGEDQVTTSIPALAEVWVEARLLQLLQLQLGDQISLGESRFTISKVLRYEPDRAGDLFSLAPRLMMNLADLDATGLIGTGARVNYRVLIAGPDNQLRAYRKALQQTLQQGEQILTVEEGRPELNTALARAQQFLGLAALISVLLAGVAVATVAMRFSRRHFDTSAMLRCLGASQKTIIRLFSLELLWLSLLASTLGCVFGLLTQLVITQLLDQLLLTQLPPPSYASVLLGYATGIVMLIGFAMPPMLALKRVPPIRVLRKDMGVQAVSGWFIYLAVVVTMWLLMYWQIGELELVATVFAGMFITLLVLAGCAYVLVRLLNRLRSQVGVTWRFGLANLARRPGSSVLQIVAFGLGIMVLLLLSTVRADLLDDWQRSLPVEAPNHFLINVQPDQVEGIYRHFNKHGINDARLYPMVRARLVEINAQPVRSNDYESERAKRFINREFNLSWAEDMQSDNTLLAGNWWTSQDHGTPLISLEARLAQTLGLKLGDVLAFDVNGTLIRLTISSLRQVDWDSFNINFFTVVAPGVLENQPASWITSLYLDIEQRQQLTELVRTYPNVTVLDVDTLMQRVRSIINKVSLAVEFIFLFTLLAGLAVLYAAIQANQDERRFENAVLRTLGARKTILLQGLVAEFVTLGALAGLLAGTAASILAWYMADTIFKFDYVFDPSIALYGLVSGVLLITTAGLLGTRKVLMQAPIQSLRNAAVN
jgi:putative ABC transport system permease protein